MIFGWLIVVDFLVIFSSSKGDTPADMSATRRPFLHLASLDQQLHRLWLLLGQAVKEESASVTTSF